MFFSMFLRPGSSFSTPQITTGTPGLELAESPRNILSSTVLLPSLSTQKATDTMKALLTTENSAPTALMLDLLFIKKGWSVVSATAHHHTRWPRKVFCSRSTVTTTKDLSTSSSMKRDMMPSSFIKAMMIILEITCL